MKKLYTLIVLGILIALVLGACGATEEPEVVEEPTAAPAPATVEEAVTPGEGVLAELGAGKWIVFVTNLGSHPWWTPILHGMQDAAAETGVEFTITGPSGYDTAAQVTQMEQVIGQQPDGIIVGVLEAPALVAVTEQARNAGIPVTWLATGGPSSAVEQLFPDEDAIGAGYADKVAELLGGKGTVGLSMQIGNSAIRQRNDAFMAALEEKYPDIELVGEYPMGGADDEAAEATAAFLQANPDLDGLVVTSGNGAGVLTALRETGMEEKAKSGDLVVVASDVTAEAILDAVRDGIFATVMQQNLYGEGYLAVYDLLLLNINPNPVVQNLLDQGVLSNPAWVDVGHVWVTKDNVEAVRDMFK